VKPSIEARIRELKADGMGLLKIGRTLGVGTSVVQRVISATRNAEAVARREAGESLVGIAAGLTTSISRL
jgi:hypothetical protein